MLARTLMPLCLILPAMAATSELPIQDGASYRTLFDDGVRALGSAKPWPGATSAPTMERLAWESVEVAARSDLFARMSATGERILYGYPEAALVDVRSGELVARLRSRLEASADDDASDGACNLDFDRSGRVVVGAGEPSAATWCLRRRTMAVAIGRRPLAKMARWRCCYIRPGQ